MKINPADITGREWRFGLHLPTGKNGEDYHMVKEFVHLKDGRVLPNIRIIKDFQRPLWVLKKSERKYTDKKEYEKLSRLDMHMTTQSNLRNLVAIHTERAWSKEHLSELLVSPWIYGGDIPSTTIMSREMYQLANSHVTRGAFTNGAFDTETDTVFGTGEIIIATMTILPEVHCIIREDWATYMQGDQAFDKRFHEIMREKIGPEIDEHNLKITYELVPTEIDIVEKSFQWFHERQPDWMSIWNMSFDVGKILDACKRANVNPKQVLCDKGIPWDYRVCRYKEGQTKKVAASGKAKPVSPYDQWHTLYLSASFWLVDAMSTYRLLRLGEQEERSYSLDAILQKELQIRKLKHAPADKYVKEKWHQVMQSQYKFEYLAYAAFDTISMAILDLKTKDLSHKLPGMADITGFDQCNSQPKRLRDAFYVFAREEHGHIIGSVGRVKDEPEPDETLDEGGEGIEGDIDDEEEAEEEEAKTLDRRGWVITLASHLSAPGLRLLEDAPHAYTGIRAFVYDSDAVSSYPSCTQVGNVAKVTNRKELVRIGTYEEDKFRRQNINLISAGETNGIEYSTEMFGAPTVMQMNDRYKQHLRAA